MRAEGWVLKDGDVYAVKGAYPELQSRVCDVFRLEIATLSSREASSSKSF